MRTQEDLNALVENLRHLKREAEEVASRIENIENAIKAEMKERNEYTLTGDDWKITWNEVTSTRFNQKLFKEANPALYESYSTESTSRRFLLSH